MFTYIDYPVWNEGYPKLVKKGAVKSLFTYRRTDYEGGKKTEEASLGLLHPQSFEIVPKDTKLACRLRSGTIDQSVYFGPSMADIFWDSTAEADSTNGAKSAGTNAPPPDRELMKHCRFDFAKIEGKWGEYLLITVEETGSGTLHYFGYYPTEIPQNVQDRHGQEARKLGEGARTGKLSC